MKRRLVLALVLLGANLSVATPAHCETTPAAATGGWHGWKKPAALIGALGGALVGTPICFMRKLPKQESEGAHSIVDSIVADSNSKLLLVPAAVIWLPFGAMVSAMEAPVCATRTAFAAEAPFSKEQFALGKLEE